MSKVMLKTSFAVVMLLFMITVLWTVIVVSGGSGAPLPNVSPPTKATPPGPPQSGSSVEEVLKSRQDAADFWQKRAEGLETSLNDISVKLSSVPPGQGNGKAINMVWLLAWFVCVAGAVTGSMLVWHCLAQWWAIPGLPTSGQVDVALLKPRQAGMLQAGIGLLVGVLSLLALAGVFVPILPLIAMFPAALVLLAVAAYLVWG